MISAIGKASVKRNCRIPVSVQHVHSKEVASMEQFGILYRNTNRNDFSLSAMATVSLVSLSNPVPVKSEPYTAFEGRTVLVESGWELVELAYDASVSHKRIMKYQCAEYYQLMIDHLDKITELAGANSFSHAQKWGYYTAVMAMILWVHPFDPC